MTFEEELQTRGRFIFTSMGGSMRPLIRQGRDVVEISARSAPLKKFDAVLYKSVDGRYILHRIIRVHGQSYDILGDNNVRIERGVKDEQVLGVLTSVLRDGERRIDFNAASYKLYVALWCGLYPLRIAILRFIGVVCSLCRKMISCG